LDLGRPCSGRAIRREVQSFCDWKAILTRNRKEVGHALSLPGLEEPVHENEEPGFEKDEEEGAQKIRHVASSPVWVGSRLLGLLGSLLFESKRTRPPRNAGGSSLTRESNPRGPRRPLVRCASRNETLSARTRKGPPQKRQRGFEISF